MNFIVTYDVPMQFNRIRTKLAMVCKDFGLLRLQYSVFWGVLSTAQIRELTVECKRVAGDVPMDMRFIAVCQKCFEQSFGIVHNARLNTNGIIKLTTEPLAQIVSHTTEGWGLTRKVSTAKATTTPNVSRIKARAGTDSVAVEIAISEPETRREKFQALPTEVLFESSDPTKGSDEIELSFELPKEGEEFTMEQLRELLESDLTPPVPGYSLPWENVEPENISPVSQDQTDQKSQAEIAKEKSDREPQIKREEEKIPERMGDIMEQPLITNQAFSKGAERSLKVEETQIEIEETKRTQFAIEKGKEELETAREKEKESSIDISVGNGVDVENHKIDENLEWGVGCRFDQWGENRPLIAQTEEKENPSIPEFLSIDDQTEWADKEFLEAVQEQVPQELREVERDQTPSSQMDQSNQIIQPNQTAQTPQHELEDSDQNEEHNHNDIQEGETDELTCGSTISMSWGEPNIHRRRRGAVDIDVLFV